MDFVNIIIYLCAGSVAAGVLNEFENPVEWVIFILFWPFAFLSGLSNAIWKTVIVRLP